MVEKNNKCNYCLEFYKKRVVFNVNSYKKRLEKDDSISNSLLGNEILNNENDNDNDDEYEVIEEKILEEFKNTLELIKI